jgi:hypothetical protein
MKVTMMLADSAQAVNGKLYILGGGWTITGPDPSPAANAILFEVPWHEANRRRHIKLTLQDGDGHPVLVPTPIGERPVEITGEFDVGRPPGLKPGTPLTMPVAINLNPLPLKPDGLFVWRLTIDDESNDDWGLWVHD